MKPIAHARRRRPIYRALVAVSLAETLIVVGLVGLLLLPVLLTSTTYFSGQILKTRQRLALAHNVNLVLNQLTNHLGATNQLISSSTAEPFTPADEIHYSFYDPVKAIQVYSGFRLTTVGSRRKLEALQYSAGTWSAISPYRTSVATAYTVPSGTVFDYCNGDGCSKTPDQATFVRLTGWTFRDESAPARTYALPTTDIYLSSRRATEGKLTGQRAKLLYSTTPSQAFGSVANLELLALSPGRKTLWAAPSVSFSGVSTPGLHTIATGLDFPAQFNMMVDETRGNVFFFDGTLGDLYQWNNSMSTATIRSTSGNDTGEYASIVSPYSGRVYYGCSSDANCTLRYYDPSTNSVSTVTGTKMNWGNNALVADPGRKVVYAGWRNSSGTDSGIIMYNEDTGYITTLNTSTSSASDIRETLSLNPVTGRLYFAYRRSTGSVRAWTPSLVGANYESGTLLSTIGASTLVTVGKLNSIQALPKANNEVLIGDNATVFKWKDGDSGVTTIYNSAGSRPMQALYYWPAAMRSIHNFDFRYDASRDIAYWYQGGTGTSTVKRGVYSYAFGTSTLRTVSNTGVYSGLHSLWLDNNTGILYWGSGNSADQGIYKWDPTTNTRTLLFTAGAGGAGGNNGLFVSADSGSLFVKPGGSTGVNIYNLTTSTLVTLNTGIYNNQSAIMDPVSSRIFFSADDSSLDYTQFSWDATSGLTTVLTTEPQFCGDQGDHAIDSVRKFFVFGCDANPANVYVYNYDPAAPAASSTTTLYKASQQGQPAGKLNMDLNPAGNYNYKAAALDNSRNLYYVNALANTIDRYAYNSGLSKYELSATLSSTSTVINATTALIIDPATAGFSVLNGSTKKVYVFANRSAATGTITPASNFNVTEATTPTGMAIDRRNGDYYIVDSAVSSSAIKIRRYTNGGVYKGTAYDLSIDVSASALGTSAATGEANFKITLDELKNVLYLAAPTLNRLYVLAIPEPAA